MNTKEEIKDLKDSKMPPEFNKAARQFGENAGAVLASATENATQYYEDSKRYVRSNPMQSVVAAAAVGAIAGGLLTLALHRRN